MGNFQISSEANQQQLQTIANRAKKLKMNASRIASSANASFKFQDGDQVTIPAQIANIITLSEDMIASAKKSAKDPDAVAEGYFVYNATVRRGSKNLDCVITVKQLSTPTVWATAQPLDGVFTGKNADVQVYSAPFKDGLKRFGEHGALHLENDVPVLTEDITFKVTLGEVYTNVYVADADKPSGHTTLIKREDYAFVEE